MWAVLTTLLWIVRNATSALGADKLIEDYAFAHHLELDVAAMDNKQMEEFIAELFPAHLRKNNFTPIRKFNLMFKTFQGVNEDTASKFSCAPKQPREFLSTLKNVLRSSAAKCLWGSAQIGKSFRNEITPGNFTFRTREFEQMELEFFCDPKEEMQWFHYWKDCKNFLLSLGMVAESIKLRDHSKEELSHYSNATTDIEYLFPFGWGELWGMPIARISTSRRIWSILAKTSPIRIPLQTKSMFPTASNPLWAQTA